MTNNANTPGTGNNDSFDINELNDLAFLDEDITPEFIEELQKKVANNAKQFNDNDGKLDAGMFEEVQTAQPEVSATPTEPIQEPPIENPKVEDEETPDKVSDSSEESEEDSKDYNKTENKDHQMNKNIDDNFIKKYKAKLNKQPQSETEEDLSLMSRSDGSTTTNTANDNQSIESLTQGNITEKSITQEQKNYNESLDFADDNIKYSKYIIYIEPENTEFIESLTVKERKNLINKILSEQGNLVLNKRKSEFVKTFILNAFIFIITLAIMLPVVYKIFNVSLESTIDNYRRSQSNFQTLYKEHGKIKQAR